MKALFVDCPTGLAGDMLLAAFFDLGVPRKVVDEPLSLIGLHNSYSLRIEESKSFGLRGKKVSIEGLESKPPNRCWQRISDMIHNAPWEINLKTNVLGVFEALAEAESFVHGQDIEEVHFHELGAIDALVDIVGVCAAIEYIKPILSAT